MNPLIQFLRATSYGKGPDTGILVLRIGTGGLMMTHGWPKLMKFTEYAPDFYNFLGLGGDVSLALTILAELCCSFLLVIGLGTRLILVPLLILGFVIVMIIHSGDPLGDKESGLMYFMSYITLILTGPGRYSRDQLIWRQKN